MGEICAAALASCAAGCFMGRVAHPLEHFEKLSQRAWLSAMPSTQSIPRSTSSLSHCLALHHCASQGLDLG